MDPGFLNQVPTLEGFGLPGLYLKSLEAIVGAAQICRRGLPLSQSMKTLVASDSDVLVSTLSLEERRGGHLPSLVRTHYVRQPSSLEAVHEESCLLLRGSLAWPIAVSAHFVRRCATLETLSRCFMRAVKTQPAAETS